MYHQCYCTLYPIYTSYPGGCNQYCQSRTVANRRRTHFVREYISAIHTAHPSNTEHKSCASLLEHIVLQHGKQNLNILLEQASHLWVQKWAWISCTYSKLSYCVFWLVWLCVSILRVLLPFRHNKYLHAMEYAYFLPWWYLLFSNISKQPVTFIPHLNDKNGADVEAHDPFC